jgi:hypothetical protein
VCKYHVSVASAYAPNVHCKSRPSFNCPSEVHNLLYAKDFTYIEYLRCLAAYLCLFFVLYPYHLSSNAPNVHSKCHLPFIVHLSGFTYIDYLRCQATYLCPFFCSLRWLCPLLSHVPLSIHFLFLECICATWKYKRGCILNASEVSTHFSSSISLTPYDETQMFAWAVLCILWRWNDWTWAWECILIFGTCLSAIFSAVEVE